LLLKTRAFEVEMAIGLICGADGVACLSYQSYLSVAAPRTAAVRERIPVSYREHVSMMV